MRRPYAVYLLAVVLPSTTALGAGMALADRAWTQARDASEARVARLALTALEAPPAAAADDDADDAGSTLRTLSRAAGYQLAAYRGGALVAATQPSPGPDTLPPAVLASVSLGPTPLPPPEGGAGRGVLVASEAGGASGLVVLARDPTVRRHPISLPLVVVMGLLLVFAALAGWIQIAGEPRRETRRSVVLLSLVPVLTAWGFLIHAGRLVTEAAEAETRRELGRGVSVARALGVAGDPEALHRLTGYHGYRVHEGRVTAASLPGPEDAVARLPAPPPSFSASGSVRTARGDAWYVALRLPEGGFVVATAPPPRPAVDAYLRPARWLAAGLAAWMILVTGLILAGRRRLSS